MIGVVTRTGGDVLRSMGTPPLEYRPLNTKDGDNLISPRMGFTAMAD
ncbi:MAG: hypothetical protein VW405_17935 [Rhodospirillaceae bacterium]